jgi:hypothetical protein
MTRGEAGTWAHLGFVAFRKSDRDASRNERAGAGYEREGRIGRHRCEKIEPGGMGGLIGRRRQILAVRQAHEAELRKTLAHDSF